MILKRLSGLLFALCLLFSFAVPAPVQAANIMLSCWCRHSTNNACNHHQIDSGIASTDGIWTSLGISLLSVGAVVNPEPFEALVARGPALSERLREKANACVALCAADGPGFTAFHYESGYRAAICEECVATPGTSCTEGRGGTLVAGEDEDAARRAELEALCSAQTIDPIFPIQLGTPIGDTSQVNGLAEYINVAYRYLVSIVLVAAIVMVVYGGFRYLFGASIGSVQEGKSIIRDAIIGMLIVLGAYTILATINPATTVLRLNPPDQIQCVDLDLPDAVRNAHCTRDTDCGEGLRCVESEGYLVSVAAATRGGVEGNRLGFEAAGFAGDGTSPGVNPGTALLHALMFTATGGAYAPEGFGEEAAALATSAVTMPAGAITSGLFAYQRSEGRRHVCSNGQLGSPCTTDSACAAGAGLVCVEGWNLCWTPFDNGPGMPCNTNSGVLGRSEEDVASGGSTRRACSTGLCQDTVPGFTDFGVCPPAEVTDSSPCFYPSGGGSAYPPECAGTDASARFVCAFCPSGAGGESRVWTLLTRDKGFPGQCKPFGALGVGCAR